MIGWDGNYNYIGMVNKNNYPHGFGRAVCIKNYDFIDGQFKEGKPHGYGRCITYDGDWWK